MGVAQLEGVINNRQSVCEWIAYWKLNRPRGTLRVLAGGQVEGRMLQVSSNARIEMGHK